ncbi:T9SS type A sorting domain-containing protein [bacterium]|nr:T9SS type A sorting domain-containing protein [bacterium]
MKTAIRCCLWFTLLSALVSAHAQDLTDLTLIAHYPLTIDASDTTGRQEDITLINTPFQDGGIYCNGKYVGGEDPDGCQAVTPRLDGFSFQKFAFSADIFVAEPYTEGHVLLIGGGSYRWIDSYLDSDGIVGFGYNHEHAYTWGLWQTFTVTYDSLSGTARCYLDGTKVDEMHLTGFTHGDERFVGITHSGYGLTYQGVLRNLKIYSRTEPDGPDPFVQDSLALVALYNATDGPNWTNNTNWLSGPVTSWYGITVEHGRVTIVALASNGLSGVMPPELGYLTAMHGLYLYDNHLTGGIPQSLGQLTELQSLHLEVNELGNTIPLQIFDLPKLSQLILSGNRIVGNIPAQIGQLTALNDLGLDNNLLEGSIPSGIGNCTLLANCNMGGNQLSGQIPAAFGDCTCLETLNLGNNQLTGEIPTELSNCIELIYLTLGNNQLTGSIPPELGDCTKLERVYLNSNQLEGEVPASLGNWTQCQYLDIYDNQLFGDLPSSLSNLTALKSFDCFQNRFTGLPDLSGIATLTDAAVDRNRLTFEDIEPNLAIPTFTYAPQDSVGDRADTTLTAGASLTLSVQVGGTANRYQWKKDKADIAGAVSPEYTLPVLDAADAGKYHCEITSTLVMELTLVSRPVTVTVTGGSTAADESGSLPARFALYQNTPNPFNPVTLIRYDVPAPARVTIRVFDVRGHQVRVLLDERKEAGSHQTAWNGLNDSGTASASGVYLVRMQTDGRLHTGKMILIR